MKLHRDDKGRMRDVIARVSRADKNLDASEVWIVLKLLALQDGEDKDLDIQYANHIEPFAGFLTDYDMRGESWHYLAVSILAGKYALKKLPAHVRSLLKERYY